MLNTPHERHSSEPRIGVARPFQGLRTKWMGNVNFTSPRLHTTSTKAVEGADIYLMHWLDIVRRVLRVIAKSIL